MQHQANPPLSWEGLGHLGVGRRMHEQNCSEAPPRSQTNAQQVCKLCKKQLPHIDGPSPSHASKNYLTRPIKELPHCKPVRSRLTSHRGESPSHASKTYLNRTGKETPRRLNSKPRKQELHIMARRPGKAARQCKHRISQECPKEKKSPPSRRSPPSQQSSSPMGERLGLDLRTTHSLLTFSNHHRSIGT